MILFWLAKEEVHDPKRAYAQTTRFELGEHLTLFKNYGVKHLVLGIEDGFTGGKYIRKRIAMHGLETDLDYSLKPPEPKLVIRSSLEATCRDAISLMVRDLHDTW